MHTTLELVDRYDGGVAATFTDGATQAVHVVVGLGLTRKAGEPLDIREVSGRTGAGTECSLDHLLWEGENDPDLGYAISCSEMCVRLNRNESNSQRDGRVAVTMARCREWKGENEIRS